ncbi:hypothetical protein [Methanohalophilus portucalensis]|uniref:Uncharacterized protein n=2 Tax=Methanohalophilus portucalensis TaxID=39664 RepID=A0A1L9C2U3_9EURY|nr:hypothetical protein [Methanohalophilus portucalensis]ATU08021.1 hypothetical protein BKM01_04060 [Methanohalophilus portucalensis]OJH48786.1 hypothetical protein MPF_1833 [Methanohalophilus portucalensis FDF-1]RNI12258.1 hypothetical protein EFE41_03890 [Methanohalophilus portucalensis FDF-1]SMH43047.1 hypothetical protein SAMN06264941_1896 [Methanohalophilus portucalensis FDF-1]
MYKIIVTLSMLLILFTNMGSANFDDIEYVDYYTDERALSVYLGLKNEKISSFTNPASNIYDPNVIKVYGELPEIENTGQLVSYIYTLRDIRANSYDKIGPDFYPEGDVVLYGYNTATGYFAIDLYRNDNNTTYSDEEIEKIYNIIKEEADKNGIENIPVVFRLTNNIDAVGYYDVNFGSLDETLEDNKEANISDSKDTGEDRSTPGFGTFLCLMMLAFVFYKDRLL